MTIDVIKIQFGQKMLIYFLLKMTLTTLGVDSRSLQTWTTDSQLNERNSDGEGSQKLLFLREGGEKGPGRARGKSRTERPQEE